MDLSERDETRVSLMCEPLSEGGRRCAAHTRPRFRAIVGQVAAASSPAASNEMRAQGIGEVSAHASTPAGAEEIGRLKDAADASGDTNTAAWLSTCLRLGASQAEAATEIRRAIRAQREQAVPVGRLARGTVLHVGEGVTTGYGRDFMRRGTYVRIQRDPAFAHEVPAGADPNGFVVASQLPFRQGDTNRARRGPHDSPLARAQDGVDYVLPRTALRTPQANDDTVAHFQDRPHYWEGAWYTDAQVQAMMARMDPDERVEFEMDLYRNT